MATSAVQVPPRDPFHSKCFHEAIDEFRAKLIKKTATCPTSKLHDSIKKFQILIETEPGLKELANNMFQEVPPTPTYDFDPGGKYRRLEDYKQMLQCLNSVLREAPAWDDDAHKAGLIGVPFNAILNWPLATKSGRQFFLNDKVNERLKEILDVHGRYLQSQVSREALPTWFAPEPLKILTEKASPYWPDGKMKTFDQIYSTDPDDKKYKGFKTWDEFFVRTFRPRIRPVQYPDKDHGASDESKKVITNACESVVYRCATNVDRNAPFWLKGQPYSLENMLAGNYVDEFVRGTVYQAWLAAECYHRWHCPVSGTIKKVINVPGTYFSGLEYYGFPEVYGNPNIPDPSGPNLSQRYITAVATRALIFIEADNPDIGLMCFIAIGMDEISSCRVSVVEGQLVMKGQELGMFHLGGSSHCLVFRPQVELEWTRDAQPPFDDEKFDQHPIIPVNKWLAYAHRATRLVDGSVQSK